MTVIVTEQDRDEALSEITGAIEDCDRILLGWMRFGGGFDTDKERRITIRDAQMTLKHTKMKLGRATELLE